MVCWGNKGCPSGLLNAVCKTHACFGRGPCKNGCCSISPCSFDFLSGTVRRKNHVCRNCDASFFSCYLSSVCNCKGMISCLRFSVKSTRYHDLLPVLYVTTPFKSSWSSSLAKKWLAPRNLNDPVFWRFSSLKKSSIPDCELRFPFDRRALNDAI